MVAATWNSDSRQNLTIFSSVSPQDFASVWLDSRIPKELFHRVMRAQWLFLWMDDAWVFLFIPVSSHSYNFLLQRMEGRLNDTETRLEWNLMFFKGEKASCTAERIKKKKYPLWVLNLPLWGYEGYVPKQHKWNLRLFGLISGIILCGEVEGVGG